MGATCVKTEAYLIRTMVSANKDCDLDLDYVEYTVKIQMGYNEVADPGLVQFSTTVDFNELIAVTHAVGLASTMLLATVGAIATLF